MLTVTTTGTEADGAPRPDRLLEAPHACAASELLRAVMRAGVFAKKAGAAQGSRPVPPLRLCPTTLGSVLADELLVTAIRLRSQDRTLDVAGMSEELGTAVERLSAGGYLESPSLLHLAPDVPSGVRLTSRRVYALRFEHLSFDSLYTPPSGMPRADEWLADEANHVAHAYVLRHDDRPRPWVVVLHGHGAGEPIDLLMMGSRRIMQELGVNILHPVLPMHGPRGRTTTLDRFPSLDPLVNFYGLSQGMWDVRQMLAWVRSQGAGPIGAYGVSLGGHAAALLASLEAGLACVVAGIPSADFASLLARHVARFSGDDVARSLGILDEPARTINRMVSPLALSPLLPRSRRFIVAGVGDRMTTPEQAVELWRHWEEPPILWVQHGHLGVFAGRASKGFVRDALRTSGVVA